MLMSRLSHFALALAHLTTVERAVKTGDFATLDLTAFIDGAEVDGGAANDISYEVGSGKHDRWIR